MKNDFVSKGSSVSDLKLHLVLTTKYRRQAITALDVGAIARYPGRSAGIVGLQAD
jgi:REP element-mobilizing transposase RayT